MEPIVTRKTWRTLEPYHALVYFAPEAFARYEALGATPGSGYFASRSAAMGAVSAEVVAATFFNFHPDLVRSQMAGAWDLARPDRWLDARVAGIDDALGARLGVDVLSGADVAAAAALARRAAEACRPHGRPLGAAHAALAWPTEDHLVLWQAITVLREFRGDGHIAALVSAGLDPCQALVMHSASGEVPADVLRLTRAWPDDEWSTAVEELAGRGLLDDAGQLTGTGRDLRQRIEDRTDELALGPWEAIGEAACADLRRLVRPWSRAIVDGGGFGSPAP